MAVREAINGGSAILSDVIKKQRKRLGVSQGQLANAIGVSRQALTRWESGAGTPDLDNVKALARFFGISLDQLFEFTPQASAISVEQGFDFTSFSQFRSLFSFRGRGFIFPGALPDYRFRQVELPPFNTCWSLNDDRWRISKVGEVDAYAEYQVLGRKLTGVFEQYVIHESRLDEVKGTLALERRLDAEGMPVMSTVYFLVKEGATVLPYRVMGLEEADNGRVLLSGLSRKELVHPGNKRYVLKKEGGSYHLVSSDDNGAQPLSCWSNLNFKAESDSMPINVVDVAGRFEVVINDSVHDCMRVVQIALGNHEGTLVEHYVNQLRNTILSRYFRMSSAVTDSVSLADIVTVNGKLFYHVSDVISARAFYGERSMQWLEGNSRELSRS